MNICQDTSQSVVAEVRRAARRYRDDGEYDYANIWENYAYALERGYMNVSVIDDMLRPVVPVRSIALLASFGGFNGMP
jgi:hypothetical protein